MSNQSQLWRIILIMSLILFFNLAQGKEVDGQARSINMAEMKFETISGMPTCFKVSAQSGDSTKEPSIVLANATAGCSFPWHWHTPNEHLMMVTGLGHLETKNGQILDLKEGGFALMPSRHVHRFHCKETCLFYIYSDAAFDLHYVDEQEKEISPSEALRSVTEPIQ